MSIKSDYKIKLEAKIFQTTVEEGNYVKIEVRLNPNRFGYVNWWVADIVGRMELHEAELIASKINAPDPIAIRQQALKEVEKAIEKLPTQSVETYDYETESTVFVDELKQAIDQLRKGVI